MVDDKLHSASSSEVKPVPTANPVVSKDIVSNSTSSDVLPQTSGTSSANCLTSHCSSGSSSTNAARNGNNSTPSISTLHSHSLAQLSLSPRLQSAMGLDKSGAQGSLFNSFPPELSLGESCATVNQSSLPVSSLLPSSSSSSSLSCHHTQQNDFDLPTDYCHNSDVSSRHPDANPFSSMTLSEYVVEMGGSHTLSRVLIANNGIAAVKAIRSIKKWSYETFGRDVIFFVAMATPEDLRANAAYIHLADEFVSVPGGSNNNNYANIELIRQIAEDYKCDAVWAGWGHASENPRLPELLSAARRKVIWIGPPPAAMRALGDKVGSTLIAQSANVPCMGWSGSGVTVNYANEGIPEDKYLSACITSAEQALACADKIGYPVMIKASEGGGGKGIRRVERASEMKLAFSQVQGEIPGSPIFVMQLAGKCRHLEVQLLCDTYGGALAVFGRDCSIQRRHQKIIEEGPVVAAPPEIWQQMEKSAVKLAKEVGYVGAGTVEYLYMDDGSYYFLELNPRLQVEHPVTELISGVNLPAAQLQIAMGIPLHRLPGIRRMYKRTPTSVSKIDFDNEQAQVLPGHVIACRITAENPDEKFRPTSGLIQEVNFRSTPDVWGYFSVGPNGSVHEFADSQFGHLFALGATREIARKNLSVALKELDIRGEIRTTVEYLRVVLEADDFKENKISTTWLENMMKNDSILMTRPSDQLAVICGGIYKAHTSFQSFDATYHDTLIKGHLPTTSLYEQLVVANAELIYRETKFPLKINRSGPSTYDISVEVTVHPSHSLPSSPLSRSVSPSPTNDMKEEGFNDIEVERKDGGDVVHVNATTESSSTVNTNIPAPLPLPTTRMVSLATVDVHNLSDGGFLLNMNGKKHLIYGRDTAAGLRVIIDAQTCLFQKEYDPANMKSEVQGKLVQWLVDPKTHVVKGQPIAEVEVMKMIVTLSALESGILNPVKPQGSMIEAGELLATMILDEPDKVKKAVPFSGEFQSSRTTTKVVSGAGVGTNAGTSADVSQDTSSSLPPSSTDSLHFIYTDAEKSTVKPSISMRESELRLRYGLEGYSLSDDALENSLSMFFHCLKNLSLPTFQLRELLSNLLGRIPSDLHEALVDVLESHEVACTEYQRTVALEKGSQAKNSDFRLQSTKNRPISSVSSVGTVTLSTYNSASTPSQSFSSIPTSLSAPLSFADLDPLSHASHTSMGLVANDDSIGKSPSTSTSTSISTNTTSASTTATSVFPTKPIEPVFPVNEFLEAIEDFESKFTPISASQPHPAVLAARKALVDAGVMALFDRYKATSTYPDGRVKAAEASIGDLLNEFLAVEEPFQRIHGVNESAKVLALRNQLKTEGTTSQSVIATLARAHYRLKHRVKIIERLIDRTMTAYPKMIRSKHIVQILTRITALTHRDCSEIVLKSRRILTSLHLPLPHQRLLTLYRFLSQLHEKALGMDDSQHSTSTSTSTSTGQEGAGIVPASRYTNLLRLRDAEHSSKVEQLITNSSQSDDLVLQFLSHSDPALRATAAHVYLLRSFLAFSIRQIDIEPAAQTVATYPHFATLFATSPFNSKYFQQQLARSKSMSGTVSGSGSVSGSISGTVSENPTDTPYPSSTSSSSPTYVHRKTDGSLRCGALLCMKWIYFNDQQARYEDSQIRRLNGFSDGPVNNTMTSAPTPSHSASAAHTAAHGIPGSYVRQVQQDSIFGVDLSRTSQDTGSGKPSTIEEDTQFQNLRKEYMQGRASLNFDISPSNDEQKPSLTPSTLSRMTRVDSVAKDMSTNLYSQNGRRQPRHDSEHNLRSLPASPISIDESEALDSQSDSYDGCTDSFDPVSMSLSKHDGQGQGQDHREKFAANGLGGFDEPHHQYHDYHGKSGQSTHKNQHQNKPTLTTMTNTHSELHDISRLQNGTFQVQRLGVFAHYASITHAEEYFGALLDEFASAVSLNYHTSAKARSIPLHVLYIVISQETPEDDDVTACYLQSLLENHVEMIQKYKIRRVSFIFSHPIASKSQQGQGQHPTFADQDLPAYFTFRLEHKKEKSEKRAEANVNEANDINLDNINALSNTETATSVPRIVEHVKIRHLDPNNAIQMQLYLLENYETELIPTSNRTIHMFAAIPKDVIQRRKVEAAKAKAKAKTVAGPAVSSRPGYDGRRFFVRAIVRHLNKEQETGMFSASPTPIVSPQAQNAEAEGFDVSTPASMLNLDNMKKEIEENAMESTKPIATPTSSTSEKSPETEIAFVEALNALEIAIANAEKLESLAKTGTSPSIKDKSLEKGVSGQCSLPGSKTPSQKSLLTVPGSKWMYNHILINVIVDGSVTYETVNSQYVEATIRALSRRYARKIASLHVTHVEFLLNIRLKNPNGSSEFISTPCRFICINETGHSLKINSYFERYNSTRDCVELVPLDRLAEKHVSQQSLTYFSPSPSSSGSSSAGTMSNVTAVNSNTNSTYLDADQPYPTTLPFQKQRLAAQANETVWCYDFLGLLEKSVARQWRSHLLALIESLVEECVIGGDPTHPQNALLPLQYITLVVAKIRSFLAEFSLTPETPTSIHTNTHSITSPLDALAIAPIPSLPSTSSTASTSASSSSEIVSNTTVNGNDDAEMQSRKKYLQQVLSLLKMLRRAPLSVMVKISESFALPFASSLLPMISPRARGIVYEFTYLVTRLPTKFIRATEFVLSPNPKYRGKNGKCPTGESEFLLTESDRAPGLNTIAMVAWKVTLFTPENIKLPINPIVDAPENPVIVYDSSKQCPGRDLVIIANDITRDVGSFGPQEDALFDLASKYSRKHRLPRWYFSANSGARIGLTNALKGHYKIAFVSDANDNVKSFEYIYLSEQSYATLGHLVKAYRIEVDPKTNKIPVGSGSNAVEARYVITDIIGDEAPIGAENLRASGTIAGETSVAYKEVYTATFVTGRSVGIGAYLARLGQRVIQKNDPAQPLLLTGYQALNKLLGRPVYISNLQLGGPDVMYTNGVSHQLASSDMDGVHKLTQWLSYLPPRRAEDTHHGVINASVTREQAVAEMCAKLQVATMGQTISSLTKPPMLSPGKNDLYDPRDLVKSLVDRNSFMEVLGGWARGVCTGRARIGGIPIGVIAVDPRTIETTIPADPAGSDSRESILTRPGGVWFPESSFKTAQALMDMKNEEIPVVVMANWRGFSGGMQDMYNEILKFGSYIVDALADIKHPVLVYLPPHSTLRGGAWVVVDETINPIHVEMYADSTARGGVLEAEGIVEIKYRMDDIKKEIHRLDGKIISLDQQLAEAAVASDVNAKSLVKSLRSDILARERQLLPLYTQVATHFADLHDTPGRLLHRGCIREIVDWNEARHRFYFRLAGRLLENLLLTPLVDSRVQHGKEMASSAGQGMTEEHSITMKARCQLQDIVNDIVKTQSSSPSLPLTTPHFSTTVAQDEFFVTTVSSNSDILWKVIQAIDEETSNEHISSLLALVGHLTASQQESFLKKLQLQQRV